MTTEGASVRMVQKVGVTYFKIGNLILPFVQLFDVRRGCLTQKWLLQIQNEKMAFIVFMSDYTIPQTSNADQFDKDRDSGKTCASFSDEFSSSPVAKQCSMFKQSAFRFELFETLVEKMEISQKVHQRAVSWMITICWSKNLSQNSLWTTLVLFYICKAKFKILKEELQLIMLTCLSLSIKMHEARNYSTKQLSALSSRSVSPADIVQKENQILEVVDFNIVIPHHVEELYKDDLLTEGDIDKAMMLCELLMVKDCSVFQEESKVESVLELLKAKNLDQFQNLSQRTKLIGEELKILWDLKQCKVILNKYSTKFDVEKLKALQ